VDAGAVRKLGFVKSGLAEFIRNLGYPAEYVMNACRLPLRQPRLDLAPGGKLNVGVFAPNVCHKNVPTQLMAALMVPGTVVHTSELPEAVYIRNKRERLIVHGILPRTEFLELLSQMHANLYVSLTECYPMTVLESLALGAVCLTCNISPIFDRRPDLVEALIVPQHDNPYAIAKRLSTALDKRAEIV